MQQEQRVGMRRVLAETAMIQGDVNTGQQRVTLESPEDGLVDPPPARLVELVERASVVECGHHTPSRHEPARETKHSNVHGQKIVGH